MGADNDNLVQMKTCIKCGESKPVSEFYKNNQTKDGLTVYCAQCNKEYIYRWRKEHPNYQREWFAKNPDYKKYYRRRDIDRSREIARQESARRRSTPQGKIDCAISAGIRDTLKRGEKRGTKWEKLVGYTVDELMRHLEKQFHPGMSWENYGRGGWHIDHKIPKSAFNYETPYDFDFKRCWALQNLQPLWEPDNIKKGNKITGSFQPSLAILEPVIDNAPVKETD